MKSKLGLSGTEVLEDCWDHISNCQRQKLPRNPPGQQSSLRACPHSTLRGEQIRGRPGPSSRLFSLFPGSPARLIGRRTEARGLGGSGTGLSGPPPGPSAGPRARSRPCPARGAFPRSSLSVPTRDPEDGASCSGRWGFWAQTQSLPLGRRRGDAVPSTPSPQDCPQTAEPHSPAGPWRLCLAPGSGAPCLSFPCRPLPGPPSRAPQG